MSRRRQAPLAGFLLLASLLATSTPAAAEEPSAGVMRKQRKRTRARSLGLRALSAYEAGNFARALDLFSQAEALFHAPTLQLGMARSHAKLGELVAALDNYEAVAREPITPESPDAFRKAVAEAKRELVALKPRVPLLRITVRGPQAAEIRVNGVKLGAASIGARRRVDPGRYRVTAAAPGFEATEAMVDLIAGDRKDLEVVLHRQGSASTGTAGPRSTGESAPAPANDAGTPGATQRTLGWVSLGVGAAAAIGGGVLIGLAVAGRSDLEGDGACSGPNASAAACRAENDDWMMFADIATGAFIAGGVGLATGLVLLLTAPSGSQATIDDRLTEFAQRRHRPGAEACTFGSFVSPQVGLCGRF